MNNSRRHVLQIGGLSAFGLGLGFDPANWGLTLNAGERTTGDTGKRCILIWLDGGPSHLETWDPKPDAPAEVRGPLETLQTGIPGVHFSECLPQLAKRIDKCAVIRSMTSPLGEHNFGTHYLMTGYKPTPVLEYPVIGSVAAHCYQQHPPTAATTTSLPPYVAVPSFRVGGARLSGNGFLPGASAPFSIDADPAKPKFQVRDLEPIAGLTRERLRRRKEITQLLDQTQRRVDKQPHLDPQFEQAYKLLTSSAARDAFQLDRESPQVRKRYGGKTVGQSCLLARRLVERGVRFVTVNQRGWDTHESLYTRLKEGYTGARVPVGLVPSLDQAVSALIDDLHDRGLLDDTLIVVMGEFGRTPKLNTRGGRDHWPRVFSVMLAGGGVAGGVVVGSSDKVGESPAENPVTPSDLCRTVYTLLGIDPDRELHTADGRPVRIATPDSQLISQLISG